MPMFKVEMGVVVHAEGVTEDAARIAAIAANPNMHVIKIEPLYTEAHHDKLKHDIREDKVASTQPRDDMGMPMMTGRLPGKG